jgi:hypothetical protein
VFSRPLDEPEFHPVVLTAFVKPDAEARAVNNRPFFHPANSPSNSMILHKGYNYIHVIFNQERILGFNFKMFVFDF